MPCIRRRTKDPRAHLRLCCGPRRFNPSCRRFATIGAQAPKVCRSAFIPISIHATLPSVEAIGDGSSGCSSILDKSLEHAFPLRRSRIRLVNGKLVRATRTPLPDSLRHDWRYAPRRFRKTHPTGEERSSSITSVLVSLRLLQLLDRCLQKVTRCRSSPCARESVACPRQCSKIFLYASIV